MVELGEVRVHEEGAEEARPITEEELDSIAVRKKWIALAGIAEIPVALIAGNSRYITVREVLAGVVEAEDETRAKAEQFTGLNTDHVFFEGLTQLEDGTWQTQWGS